MNNEEKLLKQNKSLLIIIVILLLILISLLSYFIIFNKKEEPKRDNTKVVEKKKEEKEEIIDNKPVNKVEDNNNTSKKEEITEIKQPTQNEIIDYVKKTMKEEGLIKENNIDTLTIDTVQLEGYFKKDKNIKYYAVMGNFKCKEGNDCVYQNQLDDPDKDGYYKWSTAVKTIFENNTYTFKELTTTFIIGDNDNPFIEVWEDIE